MANLYWNGQNCEVFVSEKSLNIHHYNSATTQNVLQILCNATPQYNFKCCCFNRSTYKRELFLWFKILSPVINGDNKLKKLCKFKTDTSFLWPINNYIDCAIFALYRANFYTSSRVVIPNFLSCGRLFLEVRKIR